ncbi:hypothetical protein C8J57DRAFT_1345680 [Mycena rebaudengoi]|nr:hypothetical protein C8J57DRAFT_1381612 [Mycena rebaudengoi]KAJ7255179.1 hypothetical protein C8J57DRAFT_1345680 [Mycena rebaudengoi]
MHMPHRLPSRRSEDAPRFDEGQPLSLSRYFEDIDELLVSSEDQSAAAKIKLALYYVAPEIEELWQHYATDGIKWGGFKAEIMKLYPGADPKNRYCLTHLHQLTARYSSANVQCQEDFAQYHRRFLTIAFNLMQYEKLTAREADWEYMKGIPSVLRAKIEPRLKTHAWDEAFHVGMQIIQGEVEDEMRRQLVVQERRKMEGSIHHRISL